MGNILHVEQDAPNVAYPKKGDRSDLEFKSFMAASQSIDDESRTITGLGAVFGNVDEVGDRLHPGSFKKTLGDKPVNRVPYLWQHFLDAPPIAIIHEAKEVSRDQLPLDVQREYPDATGGVVVKRQYLKNDRADEIYEGVKAGAISGISFGFDPMERTYERKDNRAIRNLHVVRLWEFSDTSIPANAATRAVKSAQPFHDGPLADKGEAWDGQAEVAKATPEQLKKMCAWCDPDHEDTKQGYKLPYKTADGKLSWAGTKAAMGALLGARGGVDIPSGDRRGVYETLAKAYRKFDEEPPDFKSLEIAWTVNDARQLIAAGVEFKIGKRNSAADEDKLRAVVTSLENSIEMLEDLLGMSEPPEEEAAEGTSTKALAVSQDVLRRLEIATRDPYLTGVFK